MNFHTSHPHRAPRRLSVWSFWWMRHFMRTAGGAGQPPDTVRMRIVHQATVVTPQRRAEFRWAPEHRSAARAPTLIDLCTDDGGGTKPPIGAWPLLCRLSGHRVWHANCLYLAAVMVGLVATVVGTFMCAGAADRRHALHTAAVRRFVQAHQRWIEHADGRRSLLVGDDDWTTANGTTNGAAMPELNADERRDSERWRTEYIVWATVFVCCAALAAALRSVLAAVVQPAAARLRGACIAALVQRALEGGGGGGRHPAAIRADHVGGQQHDSFWRSIMTIYIQMIAR